jgi:hypothetical protein
MARSIECTVGDLFASLQDVTDDDHAIVAAMTHLINSGRVRLGGKLAGARVALAPSRSSLPKGLWPAVLGLSTSSRTRGGAKVVRLAA